MGGALYDQFRGLNLLRNDARWKESMRSDSAVVVVWHTHSQYLRKEQIRGHCGKVVALTKSAGSISSNCHKNSEFGSSHLYCKMGFHGQMGFHAVFNGHGFRDRSSMAEIRPPMWIRFDCSKHFCGRL